MIVVSATVQAYVNHGRWIADCSYPDCNSAEALKPRQTQFHCSNCHYIASVEWPLFPDDITAALRVRPVPQTRNWAPAGHRQALVTGFPEGQTVNDLEEENAMHGLARTGSGGQ